MDTKKIWRVNSQKSSNFPFKIESLQIKEKSEKLFIFCFCFISERPTKRRMTGPKYKRD